jgi:hypothetical protein
MSSSLMPRYHPFLFPNRVLCTLMYFLHIWEKICDICLYVSGLFHITGWSTVPPIVPANEIILFFIYGRIRLHCVCRITFSLFIHLCRQWGWFHNLDIVNNIVVNMDVHVFLLYAVFYSFGYIPRSFIAGSYGSTVFSLLKNLPYYFP